MNKQHEKLDEESVATLELGLTKEENASKNFTISEHDIAEASEDVDLISVASIGNKAAGDEKPAADTIPPSTSSPSGSEIAPAQPPTVQEIDDDEVSNADTSTGSGGYIDEEVANAVLSTSQDRVNAAKAALYKKYCLYATIGLCVFIAFLVIIDPDSSRRREVEKHGSTFHYKDEGDYPDAIPEIEDGRTLFDTPVPFNVKYPANSYGNIVDIRGPAYRKGQMPFYWGQPGSCYLIEHVVSECYGLILAHNHGGPANQQAELAVFSPPGKDVRFVNVDLTEVDSIRDAAHMGLVPSGIAEFISSPKLHASLTSLFNAGKHSARAITIMRHPVDRAISHYYQYTKNHEDEEMTLEEFINSDNYKHNYVTNTLSLPVKFPSTSGHLALAKEIIRTKFIVGLHDRIAESLDLFEDYFFWDLAHSPQIQACKSDVISKEVDRDMDVFDKIGHRIKKGDPEYDMIAEKNQWDMELYWYAVALHEDQRAWIPHREAEATS